MFVITNNVLLTVLVVIIVPPTLNAWLTTYHHQTSINRSPSHSTSFKQHNIDNDNLIPHQSYRKNSIQFLQHNNNDDQIEENNILDDCLIDLMSKNPSTSSRRDTFGAMLGSVLLPASFASSESANAADDDEFSYKKTVNKLADVFPEAVTNSDLIKKVSRTLDRYKFDDTTLVAFSLCSDEVNRPLEDAFYGTYGEHFNMGGLAGFPFAGLTGFGAMASHIPEGGNCILVYGPHVGIDLDGNAGKINRKGRTKSGGCCGSAVAASSYITNVYLGKADKVGPPTDSIDAQQNYVSNALLPYGEAVYKAKDPMVELPFATYEPIDKMIQNIVFKAGKGVKDGKIVLLGGLQINTPRGMSDYFLPLRFDVRSSDGQIIEDLMWKRKVGSEFRGSRTA